MKLIAVVVPLLAASAVFALPLPSCVTVFWLQQPMAIGAFAAGIGAVVLMFVCGFYVQDKQPIPRIVVWSLALCLLSCFVGASVSTTFGPIYDLCIESIRNGYEVAP